MSEKATPKWKRFERLVTKVQEAFSPDATVTANDHIRGRRSGTLRQIDISVRKNIGQFNILTIIDCKDYRDPVDLKGVEDFLGLVEDVGANKGAIVSSSGFTEAATTRAQDSGVDLYRLVDAEDKDWRSYVAIPVVFDFRGFGPARFHIGGSAKICGELAVQDISTTPLYDHEHTEVGTPMTILWDMWNRREISSEPGLYRAHLRSTLAYVKSTDGSFEPIEIIAEFHVAAKLYFGQLPLTRVSGFRDEVTGKLVLPGNTEIITDWIDTVEVERTWDRIPSIDSLAVQPVMIHTALNIYPATLPHPPQARPGDA